MGLRKGVSVFKTRLCNKCLNEIVLINNDEDFSWDMHKQEPYHLNPNPDLKIDAKVKMQSDIKNMKYWFLSEDHIEERANTLEHLANLQLANQNRNDQVVKAVIQVFTSVYKYGFHVAPFGSRTTGLTTKDTGDLDLFIDTSNNGENRLDNSLSLAKEYLRKTADFMKEQDDVWSNVYEISARTPIIKALHFDTKMQCDITVNNSLGNVNSQLMIMYLKNIPILRKLILIVREWAVECDLIQDHNNMNNYGLSLMVLFYLQQEKYAPPVYDFDFYYEGTRKNICGYECIDYDLVTFNWNAFKSTENIPLKTFLHGFFSYYTTFDFINDVVCPLLGEPIKKSKFTANGKKLPGEMHVYVRNLENRGELFKINNKSMNIQDPIDLAHNITKSCREEYLWEFVDLCEASKKALENMK